MFRGSFARPFSPPIAAGDAAAIPWWLSGGLSSSDILAAYQPKGAASLAASYTNLANPGTFTIIEGSAPPWDAVSGWSPTTNNRYLRTGIIPATHSPQTMIVRYSDYSNLATRSLGGAYNGETQAFLINLTANGRVSCYNGGSALVSLGAGNNITGVVCFAGNKIFWNGIDKGVTIGAGTASNREIYLLAFNAGSPASGFVGYVQAVAIYSAALTAAQVLAVTTAMAAL